MRSPALRLLIAHNVPRHHRGGMSRIMEFLHRPLVQVGYQVHSLSSDDVPPALRGRLGRFAFPWLVRRHVVSAAARGQAYDLINVHEPSSAAVAALRTGFGNLKCVVTTHGIEQRAWDLALEEVRLGRGGPRWANRLWYPLTGLWQCNVGLRHADAVFCLSSEDTQYLVDRLGIPKTRITRIFPGADPVYADAARTRDYRSARQMLFAGTWRKNKGIQDLVPAFTRLAERDDDLHLTVQGPGVPESVVRSAFPRSIQPRITVCSTDSDQETARSFAASDIFILPSLFEGTPLTLVEAMMSGLPIVTTATCGMNDVVTNGVNGLLVPIRSPELLMTAVERLRADPALRERLGRAALVQAQARYTWDRVATVVRDAYDDLLGRHAPSGDR